MTDGAHEPPGSPVSGVTANVRVVALGASAGGLAALTAFFQSLPPTRGLAFVVIQHLDPTHGSILATRLRTVTSLDVSDMVDGEPICEGRVHVVPPGFVARLEKGHLHLSERSLTNVGRLPIDHFFASLAADQGADGVGVVLTGTGSDGTLGLAALQAAGAMTLAQEPDTAEFSGMPRSAVTTGVVDVTGDLGRLAEIIAACGQRSTPSAEQGVAGSAEFAEVIAQVRERTGHDFSGYKAATLRRRLSRRLALHQITSVGDYLRLLRDDPNEVERLGQDLLIGVTSFFRDPAVWRSLGHEVFPSLLDGRDPSAELRAWVPACSTGEEAYSLAITYLELLDQLGDGVQAPSLRIFATDVEPRAIDRARQGLYSADIRSSVGDDRFARWFTPVGDQVRISQRVRDMVVFAVHDVLNDPPFTRLELVSCRNLLIYLEPPLQQRLLRTVHHCLEPEGVLVLGMAEGTGEAAELFSPVSESLRIFRPRHNESTRLPVNVRLTAAATRATPRPATGESRLELQVLRTLAQQYAPPAVVIDDAGDLLYVSGRTGSILEAPSGHVNWNLLALVPEQARWVLAQALRSAVDSDDATEVKGLWFGRPPERALYDVSVRRLPGASSEARQLLVAFEARKSATGQPAIEDLGGIYAEGAGRDELADELARVHRELQVAYSELHAASEQQSSMNEELQTANEQLQSTNEELMVSMEEVQSMNEELQTLNQELQARVDELVSASDDMGNLLNSTEIATVFLDSTLNVRRFTPHATSVIALRDVDVGRPVSEITSTLRYPELVADALEVLRTAEPLIHDVPTVDGRWFAVRILPYRTHDDRLDGVVITFTDITAAKQLEAELRADHGPDPGEVDRHD